METSQPTRFCQGEMVLASVPERRSCLSHLSCLLPKVGAAWMPKGTQEAIMTPGKNEKQYLAGALNLTTGALLHCLGPRKTNGLFRDLLRLLDQTYPAPQVTRIYVVVDNYCIH